MPGWFASEQVAGFDRNRWLVSSEYAPPLLLWQAEVLQLDVEAEPVGDHLEHRDIALAPLPAGQQPDYLRG
jgi:hypothetical protein